MHHMSMFAAVREEPALAARDHLVGIGPLIVGIIVVILLIAALWLGRRVREREPEPPQEPQPRGGAWETPQEHETGSVPPDHGPGHQDSERHEYSERREPDEVPRNGVRHMPYEFGSGTRPAREEEQDERPRWDRGGGSHGTG
ncbi:DUF6479 family protein [Streptomyces sp. URMC 123]|uniref:DUF6479 family protein n=1 Tax=Streptomyces sp. URMC 123 TaxID=3423403 RepID=UPI003F1B2C8F